MLNSIASVGRQSVSEKNTIWFMCVKCWWTNKSEAEASQSPASALPAPDAGRGTSEQLYAFVHQYTKRCLSPCKCIQFTSERVMTRGLVPLHYSWDAFVSQRHANENSTFRLIWGGAAGLCMAYFELFFLPLVGVDVLRQGLYIDSTDGNHIDVETPEIQTRVWSRKSKS